MIRIPEHISQLKTYIPGREKDLTDEAYSNIKIMLSSNENNYGCSSTVPETIKKNLSQLHLYPNIHLAQLQEQLASKHNCTPQNIFISNGIESILDIIFRAFFLPMNEFLTCNYTHPSVFVIADKNHIHTKRVPMTPEMGFNLSGIKWSLTQQTKMIYINNPNNPTGSVLTNEELSQFLKEIPDHILVVIDEAYHEYASMLHGKYEDSSQLGFKNVITLRTFSKAYGLAGLRIGYAIGQEGLIKALKNTQVPFSVNTLAPIAAISALKDQKHLEKALQSNEDGLLKCYQLFDRLNIEYFKSYSNFILIKLDNKEVAFNLFEDLKSHGILVRKPTFHSMHQYLRISIGTTKEIDTFISTMEKIWG